MHRGLESESEGDEQLEVVTIPKKGKESKAEKTITTLQHTLSTNNILYEDMTEFIRIHKKLCLKDMGFERMIHFPIVELPSALAYHAIDHFHPGSMELRLEKGSIKATRQKVQYMLGIPIGGAGFLHKDNDKRGGSDGKEENMNGDKREVTAQMDVNNQNKELNKEKDANETEDNDKMNNNDMKNDSIQEKQDTDKDENAKVDNVKEKQGDHKDEIGEDEFWNTQFTDSQCEEMENQAKEEIKKKKIMQRGKSLKNTHLPIILSCFYTQIKTSYLFSMEGSEFDFIFETKEGNATIRDYMQTLAPTLKIESNVIDTYCLVLNHEQGVNNKRKKTKHFFHTGMITKDMFNWKMEDGKKYDEVKQYKAFSDTMKNEFKKDDEVKKLKDLEMGTTVIIDNSKTPMSYEAKCKKVYDVLKNMFSVHLKEAQHPRAKDVLNKKPTILRPKWGTEENNTYSLYMLIVSIYLCITIVVTLFCAYAACMHLITPRWEKDE
ncbi:hypothetical protein Tco_0209570 [Tanacetum coccineum]